MSDPKYISLDASFALSDLRSILLEHASAFTDPGQRRERIATAVLQGVLAFDCVSAVSLKERHASSAVELADALIAELDKPR